MISQNNLLIENDVLCPENNFGYKFNIPSNYIVYFEKEQNVALNKYIRSNYEALIFVFSNVGYNFIYAPFLTTMLDGIDNVVDYYLPQLSNNEISKKAKSEYVMMMLSQYFDKGINDFGPVFPEEEFTPSSYNYSEILELVGYKGNFNSGFTLFDNVIGVSDVFYANNKEGDFSAFFKEFVDYLINYNSDEGDASICSFQPPVELSEKLNEEAIEIVKDIEGKLSTLKDSGQLLFIIPILKNILENQTHKIDFKSISKIEIDEQYKIRLPFFNKEVVLNHLTKSIYFLFLKHPEGISLKDLGKHKKELISIYTSVSNQLDYDKMVKSIDDVINLETKSIYTHLSRIKSAYYKIMDASHSKYYIVSGNGEENRKILFDSKAIIWYNNGHFENP